MNEVKLASRHQRALFEALRSNGDVSIDILFQAIDGPGERYVTPTERRRWIGSYITRLNRRLAPHRLTIKPGDLKRTYRLNVV